MELEVQLRKIENIRTDKKIMLLLEGIRLRNSLEVITDKLLKKHETKNETINKNLSKYKWDLIDEYKESDLFTTAAYKEVAECLGFQANDSLVHTLLEGFGMDYYSLKELVIKLKKVAVDDEFELGITL